MVQSPSLMIYPIGLLILFYTQILKNLLFNPFSRFPIVKSLIKHVHLRGYLFL